MAYKAVIGIISLSHMIQLTTRPSDTSTCFFTHRNYSAVTLTSLDEQANTGVNGVDKHPV